jgi:hypothetical protein
MRRSRLLVAAALAALLATTPAAAQDDGVHYDEGSPADREYSLPLQDARQDSGGGSAAPGGGPPSEPPLFGAGIEPGGAGDGNGGKSREGSGVTREDDAANPAAPLSEPVARAESQATESSLKAGLLVGGGAVLLALAVGLAVKRLGGRGPAASRA